MTDLQNTADNKADNDNGDLFAFLTFCCKSFNLIITLVAIAAILVISLNYDLVAKATFPEPLQTIMSWSEYFIAGLLALTGMLSLALLVWNVRPKFSANATGSLVLLGIPVMVLSSVLIMGVLPSLVEAHKLYS